MDKDNGKKICGVLREIRICIAERNNIRLAHHECKNTGPCSGTCVLCDAELQYIQNQLDKLETNGFKVYIPKINLRDSSYCFMSDSLMSDIEEIPVLENDSY